MKKKKNYSDLVIDMFRQNQSITISPKKVKDKVSILGAVFCRDKVMVILSFLWENTATEYVCVQYSREQCLADRYKGQIFQTIF